MAPPCCARDITWPCMNVPTARCCTAEISCTEVSENGRSGQAYVGAFLRRSAPADPGLDAALKSEGSSDSSSPPWQPLDSSSNDSAGSGDSAQGSELEGSSSSKTDSTLGSSGASSSTVKDSDIHQTGTFCQVHHISELEGGQAQLLLLGHRRLERLHTVRALCIALPSTAFRAGENSLAISCGPRRACSIILSLPGLDLDLNQACVCRRGPRRNPLHTAYTAAVGETLVPQKAQVLKTQVLTRRCTIPR